ncbi:hypothetical protein PCANC_16082 [Puccinia coronata f. sp. avenae]|uniref:Uncharacterized protein n=1 Tax=Puccinia coronata f. sp. avenae TaxID=200324 RepID=A0A2N5TQF5_9BASI|nr:hypothetical protein PCASD_20598 [Puccinia coronata f. sp. avenae]PLW36019.1 hypothetical protein PCANC_16082 [Puccinia coronata f. sp. avenae]
MRFYLGCFTFWRHQIRHHLLRTLQLKNRIDMLILYAESMRYWQVIYKLSYPHLLLHSLAKRCGLLGKFLK